ncbi:hypothetical protein IFM89_019114 [Coptis chinensis]|uniref:Uncharacterized protein n=1 Tax=Coptis chinensis TaxID=261450 RepID=A0A835HRW3_9MAGN|nr:hypothetical protein IFM89_019114 [Coptis chinensis]
MSCLLPRKFKYFKSTHNSRRMKEWLAYLRWYCMVAMDPDTSLDSLFDAPMCATLWKADRKDENLIKFGLLWQLHDLVIKLGLDFRPPILKSTNASKAIESVAVRWNLRQIVSCSGRWSCSTESP